MPDVVLTLNAGSSSIKFALFEPPLKRIAHGEIEQIGSAPHFTAFDRAGKMLAEKGLAGGSHEDLLGKLLNWVEDHLGRDRLIAAGHRIVHGGSEFVAPVQLDAAATEALSQLSPLAPLHQPHNLAAVTALMRLRPGLMQVGCFDTAFHSSMNATARRFGLPRALEQSGIRRFGFHGLSYEFIAGRLKEIAPALAGGRIIVAHLGSGASLCALKEGRSVDTTMSFTPLDGLVMGTRCGALDPGVLLYLLQTRGMDAAALEDLLYRRSGLLGVSGISDDMRALLASADVGAQEAVELFVFRIVREIGALSASLGGLDGLVFTGGIGENSAEIRERVAARLGWLGLTLDAAANRAGDIRISQAGSPVCAWAIPTDEEAVIARHTMFLAGLSQINAPIT
jgi:acetate kinase